MSTFKRLLGWLAPYKKMFIKGYILVVAAMALRMVLPYISEAVVNEVLPNQDMRLMLTLCTVLILVTVVLHKDTSFCTCEVQEVVWPEEGKICAKECILVKVN